MRRPYGGRLVSMLTCALGHVDRLHLRFGKTESVRDGEESQSRDVDKVTHREKWTGWSRKWYSKRTTLWMDGRCGTGDKAKCRVERIFIYFHTALYLVRTSIPIVKRKHTLCPRLVSVVSGRAQRRNTLYAASK